MVNPPAALSGSPVGAAAHRRQRGFSLLELLVALMVVVLVTTLVNLSVSSGGQDIQLQSQVRSLADVASYALDEAQMTGVDYGLLLQEEQQAGDTVYRYSWLQRHIDGWEEPVNGGDMFVPQTLPPGVSMELELEDAPVVELSLEDNDYEEDEARVRPQVVFYASGETTVGALNFRSLESGDLLWRVEWDLLGRFDLLRRGEAEDAEYDR
ncbi:MAG: GspH/FimT family pseudopilin [Halioglobus sp.]|nr:GspH/FimT family pseudopilin [Halioglobus sp.]